MRQPRGREGSPVVSQPRCREAGHAITNGPRVAEFGARVARFSLNPGVASDAKLPTDQGVRALFSTKAAEQKFLVVI
jgi:hypothetical protein